MLYEKLNHMTIYGWMDGLMDIALSFLCTTVHPKRLIQAGDLSSTTTIMCAASTWRRQLLAMGVI